MYDDPTAFWSTYSSAIAVKAAVLNSWVTTPLRGQTTPSQMSIKVIRKQRYLIMIHNSSKMTVIE